jgi:hypothetical protein
MLARDKYRGADNLINAICYDITEGGNLVKDKPHTHEALKSHVWQATQTYSDLNHLKQTHVNYMVQVWLDVIEGRLNPVPKSLP